jgi:hypothetical protein
MRSVFPHLLYLPLNSYVVLRNNHETYKKLKENTKHWESQNHLDAILEASDESAPNFEDDLRRLRIGAPRSWRNSSPARLIRDHTPQPGNN